LYWIYLNENSKARLNITFIPPEDMLHIYYKMDEKTHRGISDLENSLIPAILYASIYLSTTLGNMTRGQDKRVYYVKQNVETNVAKTMLNVVNQIKKSNFNLRSLNSMYNVLDIVGKYNDYIIPLSKAGDPPVQFEVMQGQQIELKQDIIDLLETLMLNPTDVTKEIIQARNSMDYAIQATMSNTKFLRKILKRQQKTMPFLSRATSMIYNYEYSTNEIIDITLPAPEILNLTNTNQMIDANNTQIQTIIDTEMTEASEEEKNIFKRKMTRWNLNSHLPYEIIDKFMREAKVEAALLTQDSDSE
jgi:ferritin-like protein